MIRLGPLGAMLALALWSSVTASAASAVPRYTLTDLGTLGGASSFATAINNRGEVVGVSMTAAQAPRGFLYSNGTMRDLGVPDAYGINDHGQVVGSGVDLRGDTFATHAYLYSNGSITDLGNLIGQPRRASAAHSINNHGQVVGWSEFELYNTGARHAFLYSNGMMTSLAFGGYLTPSTFYRDVASGGAIDINDSGQVAGNSLTPGAVTHAVLYSNGALTDLGSLLGPCNVCDSFAYGINNHGQVVGASVYLMPVDNPVVPHAFLYSNGIMTDLGILGEPCELCDSWAYGINNHGQVVGTSATANGDRRGFLYSDGEMLDLVTLLTLEDSGREWSITEATAINDRGQIVGSGTINGTKHAVLLTPVPLPPSVWLFGVALAGGLGLVWRRTSAGSWDRGHPRSMER